MPTYTITKKFSTTTERTPRVLEVAEAFGIGLSETEFVIYDDLKIDVEDGEIVYITGQSGSGKSIMLRELKRMMSETKNVACIDEIDLKDEPIIEQVGSTFSEGLKLLAQAGLSDAALYVRKPSELSDGQRYRLRLAKLIESDADVWVADEFGAVLDRTTANVVAYNIARAARHEGKTLIVATTHTDLTESLGATLRITKTYRERVKVEQIDRKGA